MLLPPPAGTVTLNYHTPVVPDRLGRKDGKGRDRTQVPELTLIPGLVTGLPPTPATHSPQEASQNLAEAIRARTISQMRRRTFLRRLLLLSRLLVRGSASPFMPTPGYSNPGGLVWRLCGQFRLTAPITVDDLDIVVQELDGGVQDTHSTQRTRMSWANASDSAQFSLSWANASDSTSHNYMSRANASDSAMHNYIKPDGRTQDACQSS